VAPADRTYQQLHCWWGDKGGTGASSEQETMMVKLTPRQTNLTPRLTPSLLTDHMTPDGFLKRFLSMKDQRWKHIAVEGRGGEGGRGFCEKWWGRWMVFIGREG